MTAQEMAESLIKQFLPKVYCFMGSGMLSNTYDEGIALQNAKECAYITIKHMAIPASEEYLKYLLEVNEEINKINKIPEA